MKNYLVALPIVFGALAAANTSAFSMGGGSTVSTPTCKVGYVYSTKRKKCVRKKSEIIPDSDLKKQGWALAYAGNYKAAIDLFKQVANTSDPEALNGLGYTHRKLGMLKRGIGFYKLALKQNPDYVLAREYLGEGYVASGRSDLAKLQLHQIAVRCGRKCKEYVKLEKVINTGNTQIWN